MLDQCFTGNQLACSQTNRDANGNLISVLGAPINLALLRVTGVDAEASYRMDAREILGPSSQLSIRALIAYLDRLENTVPGSAPIERAGEVGLSPTPHWSASSQINLSSDVASVLFQGRLIGGGKYDVTKTAADIDFQHIKPQFYLDGQMSYKLPFANRKIELYVDVRNILDHKPPFAPGPGNIAIATNAALYDLVGRNFRFGFRARF
ncbi:TonB-dependent receptor [Sphingobium sp.]|uniref:TonB-dependent receptor n=1 Tax=Sphingobium sp. TaxID=1912891 RepID=UPI003B3B9145